jgi:SAM-dependent methyltransferase
MRLQHRIAARFRRPSGAATPSLEDQAAAMQRDWDARAVENARYYVQTAQHAWSDDEFFASGELRVSEEILDDFGNVCQAKPPGDMKVLEIGCGAGRVTRALASLFGEVHAVDVSAEMLRHAREAVAGFPNVRLYRNNGLDLSAVPAENFDFAFCDLVFQHIADRRIIEGYVREAHRLLRPGALFKFQVQGDLEVRPEPGDTWVGAPYSMEQIVELAARCGFEPRHSYGAGTQYFWNWFFKPAAL